MISETYCYVCREYGVCKMMTGSPRESETRLSRGVKFVFGVGGSRPLSYVLRKCSRTRSMLSCLYSSHEGE